MTEKKYYRLKLHEDDAFSKPPYLWDDDNKDIMPEDYERVLWYEDPDKEGYWFPVPRLYANCRSFIFSKNSTLTPIEND